MIEITEKSKCCGCYACENICVKNCITMEIDHEGFFYPVVDKTKCIECGLCESVCSAINAKVEIPVEQDGYIVQIKDNLIRRESTSGGAFTAIAQYVIRNGGVVFGAMYDDNLQVYHTYVEREIELEKFRNSKYVQSIIGDAYKKVKVFLNEGRLVCFSGTPPN